MLNLSKFKTLRLERGWTQKELGKMLNVQKAAISKYERGIAAPSNEVLKKMSAIFNVSTDYLLDNEVASKTPVYHLANDETKLLDGYRALDDSKRQTLFSMLAFLNSQQSIGVGGIIQKNNGSNNFLAVNDNQYVNSEI